MCRYIADVTPVESALQLAVAGAVAIITSVLILRAAEYNDLAQNEEICHCLFQNSGLGLPAEKHVERFGLLASSLSMISILSYARMSGAF